MIFGRITVRFPTKTYKTKKKERPRGVAARRDANSGGKSLRKGVHEPQTTTNNNKGHCRGTSPLNKTCRGRVLGQLQQNRAKEALLSAELASKLGTPCTHLGGALNVVRRCIVQLLVYRLGPDANSSRNGEKEQVKKQNLYSSSSSVAAVDVRGGNGEWIGDGDALCNALHQSATGAVKTCTNWRSPTCR